MVSDVPYANVEIRAEINPNLSNEDYIKWNVAGASRQIRRAPQELELTLMIYDLHKQVLRGRGATDSDFAEGDKIIDDLVKEHEQ